MKIRIAALRVQPRNPNKMEAGQYALLKAAIAAKGFLQPILASHYEDEYWIVDGHHRVQAARELGMVEVEAVIGNWDLLQMELIQLGMNRNRGHVSLDIAENILRDLVLDGITIPEMVGVSGFSEKELQALLKTAHLPEPKSAGLPEQQPDVAAKPFTLELRFVSEKQLKDVQKKLKKSAGTAKDVSLGLLNLLGMLE